jgi:hypothetical protein
MIFNKKYSGKVNRGASLQLLANKMQNEINERLVTVSSLSMAIKDSNTPEQEKESFMQTIHKIAHELECVDFIIEIQHPRLHNLLVDLRKDNNGDTRIDSTATSKDQMQIR